MSDMNLTLKIWRQAGPKAPGEMVTYPVSDISPDMSFLEMLDVLNEQLNDRGEEPIAFDSDCREGICGMCGLMISGRAHGPEVTATCQLHMRSFHDGEEITIEPWRADAFPVIKDLVVDRSSFDRIIAAGGFISVNTGAAPEAHSVPVPKHNADRAFDAAKCIGCGACVAACPNASAMLFVPAGRHQPAQHRPAARADARLLTSGPLRGPVPPFLGGGPSSCQGYAAERPPAPQHRTRVLPQGTTRSTPTAQRRTGVAMSRLISS